MEHHVVVQSSRIAADSSRKKRFQEPIRRLASSWAFGGELEVTPALRVGPDRPVLTARRPRPQPPSLFRQNRCITLSRARARVAHSSFLDATYALAASESLY